MRFIELVSESCLDNKGFCFEVEFHHKQQHSQTAMAMRKERLLRDDLGNNTKIEIPSNSVNISEQIVNELKQAEQAI
jgi:hypothetical protein